MKKRLITLLMAACMAMAPVSCFAEDETDYSYLEDMTVKELKALRNAIDEILGGDDADASENTDGEESSQKETNKQKDIKLDQLTDENLAALSMVGIYESLEDPYSIEWNKIEIAETKVGTQVVITFHAPSQQGDSVLARGCGMLSSKSSVNMAMTDEYYIYHPMLSDEEAISVWIMSGEDVGVFAELVEDAYSVKTVDVDTASEIMNKILDEQKYEMLN